MLCLATHLLQDPKQDTSIKLHLQDGPTKIFFLECLVSFPHLPLFGEDLGGRRGMLVVVPTPCLHPPCQSTTITLVVPYTYRGDPGPRGHIQYLPLPSEDLDHGSPKRYAECSKGHGRAWGIQGTISMCGGHPG